MPARHADHTGIKIDLYTLGVALAMAEIVELHRQADQQRLASRLPDRTSTAGGVRSRPLPGLRPPGGLLDHYDRVQREETRLRQTRAWAYAARRYALWALAPQAAASCWPPSPC